MSVPDIGVVYKCPNCIKVYKHSPSLSNHRKYECGKNPQFSCQFCPCQFHRKGNYLRHLTAKHKQEI